MSLHLLLAADPVPGRANAPRQIINAKTKRGTTLVRFITRSFSNGIVRPQSPMAADDSLRSFRRATPEDTPSGTRSKGTNGPGEVSTTTFPLPMVDFRLPIGF